MGTAGGSYVATTSVTLAGRAGDSWPPVAAGPWAGREDVEGYRSMRGTRGRRYDASC